MNTLWLIPALWLVFVVYWIVTAVGAKRTTNPGTARKGIAVRFGILALVVIVYRIPALQRIDRMQVRSTTAAVVGTALVALGIGLAIVARTYLGRNWGMPASKKENPDLITGGPYQFIRHPIYTGILTAFLGTAIAISVVWVLPLVLFGAYFLFAARREEHNMIELFPDQYPAYMKRTKMLVPFVL